MENVCFKNKGLIDLGTIENFGVSVKENDNPIGQFGTGLKYALAVFLRNGVGIKMFIGMKEYIFSVKTKTIRGKDFGVIYMGRKSLGITTELGKDWELWQAYREIKSNCLDEESAGGVAPEEGHTLFILSGPEIAEVAANDHKYFFTKGDKKPIYSDDTIDIYDFGSSCIFYKGVRIFEAPCELTYNIKRGIKLTEDRTAAYQWQLSETIQGAITKIGNVEIARRVITAEPNTFEHRNLDFACGVYEKPSEEFLKATLEEQTNEHVNRDAIICAKKHSRTDFLIPIKPGSSEHQMIGKAYEFLRVKYPEIDKYDTLVVKDIGEGVFGMAEDGKIFLSNKAFVKSQDEITVIILEEFIHLEYGYGDQSRAMQQFLFDTIIKYMKKEQANG